MKRRKHKKTILNPKIGDTVRIKEFGSFGFVMYVKEREVIVKLRQSGYHLKYSFEEVAVVSRL